MTSNAVAVAATIILLFPMGFFLMSAPPFLLVKLDVPEVAQLLRGVFNAYFLMMSITGVVGTIAFALAGRPGFVVGIGLLAAFAVWGRRWFLRAIDVQLRARDAGDAGAVRRLRWLHWEGMLSNAILLAALIVSIPHLNINSL